MKRILSIVLIVVLSLTILSACGGSSGSKQADSAEPAEEATAPNEEASDTAEEEADANPVPAGRIIGIVCLNDGTNEETADAVCEQYSVPHTENDTFVYARLGPEGMDEETNMSAVRSLIEDNSCEVVLLDLPSWVNPELLYVLLSSEFSDVEFYPDYFASSDDEPSDQADDTVMEEKKLLGIVTDDDRLFENTNYKAFCQANGIVGSDYDGYETYSAYSLDEMKKGVSSLADMGCTAIVIGNTSFVVTEDVLSSLKEEYPDVDFKDSDESILIITEKDRDFMIYTTYFGILREDTFLSLESFSGLKDYFNKTKQIKPLYNTIGANGMYRGGHAFSNESIPVPTLSENDRVICYSSTDVPTIELYPAEFIGFSPRFFLADIVGGSDYYLMYDNRVDAPNHIIQQIKEGTKIEMTDAKGSVFEDFNNVPANTLCTISWYQGTQYNEEKLVANCRVYDISDTPVLEIEGTLTRDGYAEYDFSSVPSGLYRVNHDGGLIRIP